MMTPVKDQGQYGTCWSFACMGSLEASLLKAGIGCFDLSEWHLAYYTYVPLNKSLLTAFSPGTLEAWEDPVFDQGGSDWMSVAILGRGTGAVKATACPYQPGAYRPEPRPLGDLPNGREEVSVPLEHALYLFNGDTPITTADIKYAVTNLGPAVITMDWEDANFFEAQNTYRDTAATVDTLNHEVCIVGWDDAFAPDRFPPDNRPASPGAWIVRNSWSRAWGEGGYFYLSYDSKVFDGTVFLGGNRITRRIHQVDPLGWCGSRGFGASTAYCANLFRTDTGSRVTAVAFYAGAIDTSYEIEVLAGQGGMPGPVVPPAFELSIPQKGTLQAPGFHIVPLDNPVALQAGDGFAVVLKLTTPGYLYPIPVQEPEVGYSDRSTSEPGRSFISADGQHWQDLAQGCSGASLCVKALTDD